MLRDVGIQFQACKIPMCKVRSWNVLTVRTEIAFSNFSLSKIRTDI